MPNTETTNAETPGTGTGQAIDQPRTIDQPNCIRCSKALSQNVRFCPFCAAEQPPATEARDQSQNNYQNNYQNGNDQGGWPDAGSKADGKRNVPPNGTRFAKARRWRETDEAEEGEPFLVLRAGEKIWHFEEEETRTERGQPRPWLVVDEQVTHLSRTDRELVPDVLLSRVQALLGKDRVPVQVQLLPARWQSDPEERRPRLVASLENHRYSDIKMLLGLDYLGSWASIHLELAVEPAPLPVPPPPEVPPAAPPFQHPLGAIICLVLGVLAFIGGNSMNGNSFWDSWRLFAPLLLGAGILLGLAGAIAYMVALSNHGKLCAQHRAAWEQEQERRRQAWETEQHQRARQNAMDRLSRTFKVDDMRLFSTAMREVYQQVVDDVVAQGAQVARIEGGHGGFFEAQGVARAAAPARQSDAASLGV